MHTESEVLIRPVTMGDLPVLQAVSRQTFIEAFAADNTEANMQQYLNGAFSAEQLQREIGDPGTRFFFATRQGEVVGYLKLNTGEAQSDLRSEAGLEIERIYVVASCHGLGIGQRLLEKALSLARKEDRPFVWLGVWEHNYRALRFYKKHGFEAFGTHGFMLGDDAQTDILMKRPVGPADHIHHA